MLKLKYIRGEMMVSKKHKSKKTKLEKHYEELFKPINVRPGISDNYSLAQQSPMKPITGVVTYGLYEEPILGE
jgi:hypothetical protein